MAESDPHALEDIESFNAHFYSPKDQELVTRTINEHTFALIKPGSVEQGYQCSCGEIFAASAEPLPEIEVQQAVADYISHIGLISGVDMFS